MSKHVIIIGAGIIGVCTGHYLSRRGFRVSIIDRSSPEAEGCSFGNAGLIVPSHFVPLAAPGMVGMALRMTLNSRSPFYVKPRFDRALFDWGWKFHQAATKERADKAAPLLRDLNMASRACYEQLANECGNEFELVRGGLFMLCRSARGLEVEARMVEQSRQLGMPAELLDAKQLAEREPGIAMNVAGAVYFPMDAHVTPGKVMASIRRRLVDAGVAFHWNTEAAGWRVNGNTIEAIRLGNGDELTADEYVLCGGILAAAIARDLQLRLPMQPGKGYSLTLPSPRRLPKACAILTEARVAVTPMGASLRFAGTMEMSGLNHHIRPNRVRGIIDAIPTYYPEFSAKDFVGVQPWCGLRPCSPDGLPYIGRTARYRNLCIGAGHAMMGLSLGPVTGRIIARILEGEKPERELGLVSPDRYLT